MTEVSAVAIVAVILLVALIGVVFALLGLRDRVMALERFLHEWRASVDAEDEDCWRRERWEDEG